MNPYRKPARKRQYLVVPLDELSAIVSQMRPWMPKDRYGLSEAWQRLNRLYFQGRVIERFEDEDIH